jgi:hypothetical protein
VQKLSVAFGYEFPEIVEVGMVLMRATAGIPLDLIILIRFFLYEKLLSCDRLKFFVTSVLGIPQKHEDNQKMRNYLEANFV